MRYYRYGVDLERLEARHLEMVRQWRNQDAVRLQMRYAKEISPAAQAAWFKKLDPHNDWYFVAQQKGTPFGLFHVKEVDWSRRCGEAGGFVSRPQLIGGLEAGIGILALMDFAFLVLGLDSLEANYHCGHAKIVRLNRQLGYQQFAELQDDFVRARVSAEGYFREAANLRQAATRIHGAETSLTGKDRWLTEHIKKLNRTRTNPSSVNRLKESGERAANLH